MPRPPRLDIPGIAQHVVQRGNNRQACFLRNRDRIEYLDTLRRYATEFCCAVHAYVLMDNHVHLLMTPESEGGVSRTIQALGRRYVRWLNDSTGRSGTLWEGRFKACLVDNDRYFLACQRYIELNPVRAGLVLDPAGYRWSSYHSNALGHNDPLLEPHASYLALGPGPRRQEIYRQMVQSGVDDQELESLRRWTRHQRPWGSAEFRRTIEAATGQRTSILRPGRPCRQGAGSN